MRCIYYWFVFFRRDLVTGTYLPINLVSPNSKFVQGRHTIEQVHATCDLQTRRAWQRLGGGLTITAPTREKHDRFDHVKLDLKGERTATNRAFGAIHPLTNLH